MSYEVAALGQGALCGLLLRHYGINVLLDAHAVPTLEAAAQQQQPAASTAAASTAGAPSLQLSLQLTVPHYARLLQSVHQLHAVLLTNPWALLGLPALQQHLRSRGAELPLHTYATEPCLHSFQQLVQELQDAQHALQQQQQQHATASATSQQQQHVSAAPLPSVEQLQSVLDAVQAVRFGQQLQLPGCLGLTAEARPAGSSIGSCVWHLRHGSHRILYLAPACVRPGPARVLHQPCFQQLHSLLLGPGCLSTPAQAAAAAGIAAEAAAAAHAAAGVAMAGGSVLVPVTAAGDALLLLLDQLDAVLAAAAAMPSSTGHSPRVWYLSPAAADKLATADSCCEYLEQQRQLRVLAHGEAPFASERMAAAGRLHIITGSSGSGGGQGTWSAAVQEVLAAGPCVALVPLWSMAAGPGAILGRAWCSSPANALLLLPESQAITTAWLQQCRNAQLLPGEKWQVLQPANSSQPDCSSSSWERWPRDALSAEQLVQLLGSTRCKIAVSEREAGLLRAAEGSLQQQQAAARLPLLELLQYPEPKAAAAATDSSSASLAFCNVALEPSLIEAALSSQLADQLQLQLLQITRELHPWAGCAAPLPRPAAACHEVSVARVRALLSRRGRRWLLEPLPEGTGPAALAAAAEALQQPQPQLLWGSVQLAALLQDLQAAGFAARWLPGGDDSADPDVISVNDGAAEIRLSRRETEIACDDCGMRSQLQACVMRQLHLIA